MVTGAAPAKTAQISAMLEALGLTPGEILSYNLLIGTGPQSASALAKATGQSRGRAYLVLRGLVERGFVREEPGAPNRFHGIEPDRVLRWAAESARNQAQQLELAAKEAMAEVRTEPPAAAHAPLFEASLLHGRRAVAAEILRILERARQRFYVAGAGRLSHRIRDWDALQRALRVKALEGVNVAVAAPAGPGMASLTETLPNIGPALAATLALPTAFPVTLVVGDDEALLVAVHPDDASPTRGDDEAVHLRGPVFAQAFSVWFERVALGGPGAPSDSLINVPSEAREILREAIRTANHDVSVMGSAGWLKLLFEDPKEPARPSDEVDLRLLAEADPSAWRTIKPLSGAWEIRLVRNVPMWAVVIDGSLTFTGVGGEGGSQVQTVRRGKDPAEAQQYLALFQEFWKKSVPMPRRPER